MQEFGHFGVISGGVCIDSWGVGPFLIVTSGRTYRFEDSDRFGPLIIRQDGGPSKQQPGQRSPFWKAHRIWRRQGRRLLADGQTCIFDTPKPTTYSRFRGMNLIVESGDEDGEFIEVQRGAA